MPKHDWVLFWIIGLAAICIWAAMGFWSREARLERRRRRSHSRLVSKANRPSVRFGVQVPKKPKKK